MKLSQLAEKLHGKLIGIDANCRAISINTKTIDSGDVFFAIVGAVRDGHDFIADAEKAGASGVVVSREVKTTLPIIIVSDTRKALFDLTEYDRERTAIPFVAITGSCGKTTTRALLENILKQVGPVLASEKSFNNDLGVPLTVSRLKPEDQFAVLEIGANHIGEISVLSKLVKPTIAVITMIAPVHLEGFGSVENIAQAKSEIFEGLEKNGIAIINQDDHYANDFKNLNKNNVMITFGINHQSDVMAKNIICNEKSEIKFLLSTSSDHCEINFPLIGEHNITNALAAAACAVALNIPIQKIKIGLETVMPVEKRLNETIGFAGATIIDDSYNANPTSVRAAIRILTKRPGESILVLGDMLELGQDADDIHAELGRFALDHHVNALFCYGKHSAFTAKAFGKNAHYFADKKILIESLKSLLSNKTTIVIKGSNSMKMWEITQALTTYQEINGTQ
ncbi:MAG: hypothetical protein ACD_29C00011G0003 [uncultured bacterium]|nr:MAG: hypothetical protein ACD_29C00011G0003 [uncultured bacterium]